MGVCLPAMGRHRQRWELRLGGQPGEKKLIAKEKNKIQIFISHNCILDLGLDPVEAESSSPAHPGLEPGPHSRGVFSPPAELRAGVGAPGMGRDRGVSPCPCAAQQGEGVGLPRHWCDPLFPLGYKQSSTRGCRTPPGESLHRPADEESFPPLSSRGGGLRINPPEPRNAAGCAWMLRHGAGRAGPTDHTRHGCPGSPAGLAQPWEGAERESDSCPAGGTLSAPAPPREGPLTMRWPRGMERRVYDSLFLVTHGFAGLRQCHGKYFFNNSKGGGGVGNRN